MAVQKPAPERAAVIIEMLAGDAEARRAAVSWPLVPKDLKGAKRLSAWSKASGISRSRLDRISDMLMAHGICREDRTLDPEAVPVLEHLAAEVLRKHRPK